VLDNCEQVIGAAAELCGRLLLGADDVRVLATSPICGCRDGRPAG
jgi:predicted ATPase